MQVSHHKFCEDCACVKEGSTCPAWGGGVRAVGPVHKDPRGTRMSLGTRREADSKARDTDLSLTFVLG